MFGFAAKDGTQLMFLKYRYVAAVCVLAFFHTLLAGCGGVREKDGAVWSRKLDGGIRHAPATGQGLLFVADRNGALRALTLSHGSNVWTETGLGSPFVGPVAAGPAVCQATIDGYVYGMSAWTGARLWSISPFGPMFMQAESRFVTFLNALDGHVYGLDAVTGDLKWDFDPGRGPVSGLCIHSNTVFVLAGGADDQSSRRLIGLSAQAGEAELEIPLEHDADAMAAYGGIMYMGNSTGLVWAIELSASRLLWRRQTGHLISTPLSAQAEGVYYGTLDGHLYGLDAKAGKLFRQIIVGSAPVSALAIDGVQAFIAERKRHWLALDTAAGAVLWKVQAPAADNMPPALGDRCVVWVTPNGWVRAFQKMPSF